MVADENSIDQNVVAQIYDQVLSALRVTLTHSEVCLRVAAQHRFFIEYSLTFKKDVGT